MNSTNRLINAISIFLFIALATASFSQGQTNIVFTPQSLDSTLNDFKVDITDHGNAKMIAEDFNGDGKEDLFFMTNGFPTSVKSGIYWNQGSHFSVPDFYQFYPLEHSQIASADVDNDGDIDIVYSGINSSSQTKVFAYYNNGTGQFNLDSTNSIYDFYILDLHLADLNNDSLSDIIVSGHYGNLVKDTMLIYFNDGNGDFVVDSLSTLYGIYDSKLFTGDIDNDGDIDIFHTDEDNYMQSVFYLNDGSGYFTIDNGAFLSSYDGRPQLVDVNGDQYLDLVNNKEVYLNDGLGNFYSPYNLPYLNASGVHYLADFDGDGDNDMIISNQYGDSTVLLENNGTGNFVIKQNTNINAIASGKIICKDFDNDGKDDLLLHGRSTYTHRTYLYMQDSAFHYSRANHSLSYDLSYDKTKFTDLDEDGDLDLYLASSVSPSNIDNGTWYINTYGSFEKRVDTVLPILYIGDLLFEDFDNDSLDDLICAGIWNNNKIFNLYKKDLNGNFTLDTNFNFGGLSYASIQCADFDGNGYMDIIAIGSDTSFQPVTKLILNNGPINGYQEITNHNITPFYKGALVVGDIDGDSDQDIIVQGRVGPSVFNISEVYLNNGQAGFTLLNNPNIGSSDRGSLVLEDFDNDGDLDLFQSIKSSQVNSTIYFNNGQGIFSASANPPQSHAYSENVHVDDFDNDGDPDILTFNQAADVDSTYLGTSLYLNDGIGNFTIKALESVHNYKHLMSDVGDIDNDSFPDIVAIGISRSETKVARLFKNESCSTLHDTSFITSCGPFTWDKTGITYSSSGIFSDSSNYTNICDTVYTLVLNVNAINSSYDTVVSCGPYLWYNGNTINTSGLYSDTLTGINGCDSIALLNLTVEPSINLQIHELTSNNCPEDSIASLFASFSSGSSMFSVLWSNGDTSNIVDSIAIGTYYVDVYNQTSGCHATDSHTVSFYDNVIPNVIAKNDTIYLDSNGNALVHVQDIDNGSFDNCHIDSLYLTQQNFNCNHIGNNTTYLVAIDPATNQSIASANILVLDTIKPHAIAQDIQTTMPVSGLFHLSIQDVNNGSYDNCSIANYSLSQSQFNASQIGTHQLTLYVEDVSGNIDSSLFVLELINDTIAPILNLSSPTFYLDNSGSVTINFSDIDSSSFDNSGSFQTILSPSVFTCSEVGVNSVIVTATDSSANSSQLTLNVNILDTISPIAIAQNITIYLNDSAVAIIDSNAVDNGSTDNCIIQEFVTTITSFDQSQLGTNSVVLNVIDSHGNFDSAWAVVTVLDTISPKMLTDTIPAYLDAQGNATLNHSQIQQYFSDNIGIGSIALSDTTFSCLDLPYQTINATAIDIQGNSNSFNLTIHILDTISPSITCPDTLFTCEGILDYNYPNFSDNCLANISLVNGLQIGDSITPGQFINEYKAEDVSGNISLCFQTIVVYPKNNLSLGTDTVVGINDVLSFDFSNLTGNFNWHNGDSNNQNSFTIQYPQYIWVENINEFGCISSDSIFVDIASSNDQVFTSIPKIYPVPTRDVLNIYVPETNECHGFVLIDLNGKEVIRSNSDIQQNQQVHLKQLAKGTYILKLFLKHETLEFKISKI